MLHDETTKLERPEKRVNPQLPILRWLLADWGTRALHADGNEPEMKLQTPVQDFETQKVIHVVTALDFGGVESMMVLLARSEKAAIFKHHFCGLSRGGWASQELESLGFRAHLLGLNPKIPSLRAVMSLYRLFLREKPLVVHSYGAEANFSAVIAAFLARVRVRIVHEIGIPKHSRLARTVFASVYRLSTVVAGVSQTTIDEIVRIGEVAREKCEVLWVPVGLAEKPIRPSRGQRFKRICFVGRLEAEKNPLSLIHALKLLRDAGQRIELLIFGDGSQRGVVESLCIELGISDSVRFLGFMEQPSNHMSEVDLFVQPSVSEGLSLALIEMMSAEVPALASSNGGGAEVIQDGENGWLLFDVGPEAIASRISQISALSGSERRGVGIKGRRSVERKFAANAYVRRLELFYSRTVSQRAEKVELTD